METKELNEATLKFALKVKNELLPFDGVYYVDYRTIKSFCGVNTDSVFRHIHCCYGAKYMDDEKGVEIESTTIDMIIASMQ